MIPKVLLNTDILSEYLKGRDKSVARRAADYARHHGAFTFTSVTVHEIVFGLELKGASAQQQRVIEWLQKNEEITPAADDYITAAVIKAAGRKQGSILELTDCLIAATAIRIGLTLVTGNTQHFESIRKTGAGLIIDNWRA